MIYIPSEQQQKIVMKINKPIHELRVFRNKYLPAVLCIFSQAKKVGGINVGCSKSVPQRIKM